MEPSKQAYNDNVASTDATQNITGNVGRLYTRNSHAWGKYTKAIVLVLVILTVIAIPAITVSV